MKKLVLGLILVAVLVAVSYFKSDLDARQYSEGYKAGRSQKAEDKQTDVDSLDEALKQQRQATADRDAAWQDSLTARDSIYAEQIDSMTLRLTDRDEEIFRLQGQASKKAASIDSGKTNGKARHVDILKHYRLAIDRLPSDLTAYERRVEVDDIRGETASKFSITVKRLDEIRDMYKIDF